MRWSTESNPVLTLVLLLTLVVALIPEALSAQSSATAPTIIPVSGQILAANGQPRTGPALLVLSLYEGKDDPAPRWIEHQAVTLDAAGRYAVQFGATRDDGLPADLFTGEVKMRWLGIGIENEAEQARVMLVSVPYAAKAASADTLAGKSVSDFVLTSNFKEDVRVALQEQGVRSANDVTTSAVSVNYVQKGAVGGGTTDSTVVESSGNVGIGTATPGYTLEVHSPSGPNGVRINAANAGGTSNIFLDTTAAFTGTRNWLMTTNYDDAGDFAIRDSNAYGGMPTTPGPRGL